MIDHHAGPACSKRRIGHGLVISNRRKAIKQAINHGHESATNGAATAIVNHCPAHSSITIHPGSCSSSVGSTTAHTAHPSSVIPITAPSNTPSP